VWGEHVTSDAQTVKNTGSPNKIAVYTHGGGVSQAKLLHHSVPTNDAHAQPGMVLDRSGRLHVITGGHASHFFYIATIKSVDDPDFDIMSTWTQLQPVVTELNANVEPCQHNTPGLPGGCQTYLSFMRDQQDTLHIVYRQYRTDRNGQHGKRRYAALTYQKKPANAGWGRAIVLVVPPLAGYWNYHHHMTMDRDGRIFLTYTHSDTTSAAKSRRPYSDIPMFQLSSMLFSADAGETWTLVTTNTFRAGFH
jgi:hypothetical protein